MARKQKSLHRTSSYPPEIRRSATQREKRRVREVAGGATAEVAAVCFCLPCAMIEMVVLAAYKVPAGLMKKAVIKRKRRRVEKMQSDARLLDQSRQTGIVAAENEGSLGEHPPKNTAENSEAVELEKEMWAQFNGTGFWRSSSQREQQHEPQPQLPVHVQTSGV